jgi:uncharacterized protein (TIGR00369 family)
MTKHADLRDRIPFVKDLGIELLLAEDGQSRLELDVQPRHLNGWGAVHGGVTMTVLDVAMAIATRTLQPRGEGVATIEMKTSFMQAGPTQGRLVAAGTCVHRSGTMVFCEAEVLGDDDRLVARASGTFKLLRQPSEERDLANGAAAGDVSV